MMVPTFLLFPLFASSWMLSMETSAFTMPIRSLCPRSRTPVPLNSVSEQTIREEIARKNIIAEEGQYGVLDGHIDSKPASLILDAENQSTDMQREITRAVKRRAYPLFILEKIFQVVDDIVDNFRNMDSTSDKGQDTKVKERIVILGTGWGSAALLKEIDAKRFDVTVISPRNYFLFTPMLAGAAVGTVEFRSITEPVRQINPLSNYIEARATDIDPKACQVSCESIACEGNSCVIEEFTVPYDRLVIAVGAQTNTFGIPGVREYCCFLKEIEDSQRIRRALVNCFERASIPNLSDEEKEKILTFAVIGAGPTGIEFASELRDFITSDIAKYYGKILKFARIKIIEASSMVLSPFDPSLQAAAIEALNRRVSIQDEKVADLLPRPFKITELILETKVEEVKKGVISLSDGREIPYGLAVWAAGNGPLPVTLNAIATLGMGEQADAQAIARGRIAIDPWLRVLGGDGKIFSFGDCSCNPNYQLPATAQVASQQGEYLGRMLSLCDMSPRCKSTGELLPPMKDMQDREEKLSEKVASFATQSDRIGAPFQFLDLGILAYTGDGSAIAQIQVIPDSSAKIKEQGKVGFGLWRSVYLTKQISLRNRVLVALDWTKTKVFGRDITLLM